MIHPTEIIKIGKGYPAQFSEDKIQYNKPKDALNQNKEVYKITDKNPNTVVPPKIQTPQKSNMFVRGLKSAGRFVVAHPVESVEIAGIVIGGVAKAVSYFRGSSSNSTHSTVAQNDPNLTSIGIVEKAKGVVEMANKSILSESEVSGHRQRYHTKSGILWKDKAPYHRGGNKE